MGKWRSSSSWGSCAGVDRHALPRNTVCDHGERERDRSGVELLAEDRHRGEEREKGLHQLHLADAHRAAERQPPVPGKKPSHIENKA